MLPKIRKTLDFKKIMVYKIPPGLGEGGVNHIWPLAIILYYRPYDFSIQLFMITINSLGLAQLSTCQCAGFIVT